MNGSCYRVIDSSIQQDIFSSFHFFFILSESVKKGKFVTKIFFQIMLNEILKSHMKMISADVKANVKQYEIKYLVAVSYKFF